MSTLYVAEFDALLVDAYSQSVMAPNFASFRGEQNISMGSHSTPMKDGTRFVLLVPSIACFFTVGKNNPVANVNNTPLAPGGWYFIGLNPGDQIAVTN